MNLGSPSPMSLLELARKVIEATRSESEIIFDAPVSTSHTSGCPILRARQLLDWKPKISIEEVCAA